jgi:hypothetical protein
MRPYEMVSIPYWLGSKLRAFLMSELRHSIKDKKVSIPYWLGSKLRGLRMPDRR